MRFLGCFQIFCIDSFILTFGVFFFWGGYMKAKTKVLDVLYPKDRATSTENGRTILSEKEFKEFLRQLKEGEKDQKIHRQEKS